MPDLRQLRAFVAVAEQLSFTQAAELLHLKQQTVSKTVRDLERELGVELLERTTREVRVTGAGAALIEPAKETLRQAEAAFETVRAIGSGKSGTVRVGVTPAIGPDDRIDAVRALRSQAADVSVSLRDLRPGDLHRSLRARDVDIALTRVSGTEDASLHHAELRPTPMRIYVPATHRLADKRRARLEQFDGERLLTASPTGTPYTEMLVSRFARAGARVVVVEGHVTGGAVFLTELESADAIAVMPAGTTPPEGVVGLAVDDFELPLIMLWPAGLPSGAVARLREVMGIELPRPPPEDQP